MQVILAAFLLAIAGRSQAGISRDTPPPPPAQATISGRVTARDSGQPLARIVVTLRTADGTGGAHAITDADGRYQFAELAAGKYILSAAPEEHRSTYLRQRFGEAEPAPPFDGALRPNVELAAGEHKSGADMALWRALAIEGRIADPWDHPMAEVQVGAVRLDGDGSYAHPASSDDLGQYRVYGLPPGRYRVCADVRGYGEPVAETARFARTCHPSALVEGDASDVVLTSADASGIDIRLQRIRSYSISGTVVDAAGAPADGATISALALAAGGSSGHAVAREGAFVVKGLTPGRYIVRAAAGDAERGRGDPRLSLDAEAGYASADVSAGDAGGIAIALSKPVQVAGRVVFDGSPAPRGRLAMTVQTTPAHDPIAMHEHPRMAPVGDDSTFELKGLHRLPVLVVIRGLPHGWILKAVRYEGRDITYVPTDFAGGSPRGGLQIVVTNRIAQPSIRVFDANGAAAPAFVVVAVPADRSTWQFALQMSGSRGGDDVLKLDPMLPGQYVFAAIPVRDSRVLMHDRARVDALATIGTPITVTEGDSRTIDLRLVDLPPAR